MISLKKIFFFFKIIFLSFVVYLFFNGLLHYKGNFFIYVIFSILGNYLLFYSFRKNAFFFESFFGLFIWLGFWFKFVCVISFRDGQFPEGFGNFNNSPESFDYALLTSIVAFLATIFSYRVREQFFNYHKKKLIIGKNTIYTNNKKIILFMLFTMFILIGLLNLFYGIYQKGMIIDFNINIFIHSFFKWALLFGFAAIFSLIVFFEINIYKKFFSLSSVLLIFESFFSYSSMLSRAMIFNILAIIYGVYRFSSIFHIKLKTVDFVKFIFLSFFLFYLSSLSVNYLRANYFYQGTSYNDSGFINLKLNDTKKDKISFFNNNELFYLAMNRWVGIDSLLAVVGKKDILNLELLKDSLKEQFKKNKNSFYEETFSVTNQYNSKKSVDNFVKGVTLPGIVAFLFYSGSFIFLFVSLFCLIFISSFIEYLSFKITNFNMIFSALIGQVIAYRWIHFGYIPMNSYLLFSSIILTIFLIFFLFKIFNLKNK
jgi:hypothetical protein